MNDTIKKLIAEFGEKTCLIPLIARGWKSIGHEPYIAAKRQYVIDGTWGEGFSELLDGRIVYRDYFGGVMLAPPEYQPATIGDQKALYREVMGMKHSFTREQLIFVVEALIKALASFVLCTESLSKDRAKMLCNTAAICLGTSLATFYNGLTGQDRGPNDMLEPLDLRNVSLESEPASVIRELATRWVDRFFQGVK